MADETLKSKTAVGGKAKRREPVRPSEGFVSSLLTFLGEFMQLALGAISAIARGQIDFRDTLTQMAAIGADSLPVVLTNTASTGAVFAIYTSNLALQLGFPEVVGGTLGYAFLNELGPVLAGAAFATRSGAAIAAEIGTMVVTEQVDALRAMAVSPTRYLVVPRLLACVIMLPLLTVIADMCGLLGGYLSATSYGIAPAVYWDSIHKYVQAVDFTHGLIKSVVFGFIIGIVACQQGLRTKGGATGVGRSTTSSVVLCSVLIFISDFFLAQVLTPFGGRN